MNETQSGADFRIFDGQNLGAFASNHSFRGDSFGYLWRRFTVDQRVEQSRSLVGHSFKIVSDAGERYLNAITDHRIIIDA